MAYNLAQLDMLDSSAHLHQTHVFAHTISSWLKRHVTQLVRTTVDAVLPMCIELTGPIVLLPLPCT